ncbi:MAG TPA: hypothetical protein VMP01_24685 [Pirellulaceae bacterium]|nr:hypothetical protein [Pirellulaceae bacterium]
MCRSVMFALVMALAGSLAVAQDYKVEKLESGPPADKLSPEIAKLIGDSGCKILRGETRTLCEIWTVKELDVSKGKTNDMVLYPLEPGQLIGVIRLPRKATDFRNQEVTSGVYTLRYGQQPVDGAHVGTFPTRDFVLLLPAEEDKSPATIGDYKTLTKASAASAGTTHPAIYPLLKPSEGETPSIRHDEEKDWWIVRFGSGKQAFDMVIVGHAEE